MSAVVTPVEQQNDIEAKVRERIAAGAALWEVPVEEMPLWLLRGVRDGAAAISAVFLGPSAGMVLHADGSRTLKKCPWG